MEELKLFVHRYAYSFLILTTCYKLSNHFFDDHFVVDNAYYHALALVIMTYTIQYFKKK